MKTILVCVDFHESTNILIEKAIELAKKFGSKVWLLHVSAPDPDFVGYEVGPQYIRDVRAHELKGEHRKLLEYVDQVKSLNIDSEALLISGPTIEMVIQESEKLNVDLIITGHHEHSFYYKVFSSSTSSKIISKSDIPVLVVPFGK